MIGIIKYFVKSFMLFNVPLMFCFIVFAFFSLVANKFFHSVFKDVEERVLGILLNGLLFHQLL